MKQSTLVDNEYYVIFKNGDKGYYCARDIQYVSETSPNQKLTVDKSGTVRVVNSEARNVVNDLKDSNVRKKKQIISILTAVKLKKPPHSFTYNELVLPFKVEFPWLNSNILRKHVHAKSKLGESKEEMLPLAKGSTDDTNESDKSTSTSYDDSSFAGKEPMTEEKWKELSAPFHQRSLSNPPLDKEAYVGDDNLSVAIEENCPIVPEVTQADNASTTSNMSCSENKCDLFHACSIVEVVDLGDVDTQRSLLVTTKPFHTDSVNNNSPSSINPSAKPNLCYNVSNPVNVNVKNPTNQTKNKKNNVYFLVLIRVSHPFRIPK